MPVLYRKYRPQKFADVVGQNHIKTTLANEIAADHLAHAYVFVGPRGTGKTTVARLLARAVNCLNRKAGEHEPCNECDSCQQILQQRSMDIIEIDAATHTQVDNVRENIIANAYVPPYNSKGYKVFIIDEVHMLSKASFNALLKIIEEPPQHVIFILATTEIRKVPATIISRCQRFDFRKIPIQTIVDRLAELVRQEKIEIDKEILVAVARRSEGCMRDAESLLGQILGLSDGAKITSETASLVLPRSSWKELETLLERLLKRDTKGALQHVHTMVREGQDIDDFTSEIVDYIRHILLAKTIGAAYAPDLDDTTARTISDFSKGAESTDLLQLLDIMMDKASETRAAMIPQLPLELGIIEFCFTPQKRVPSEAVQPEDELPVDRDLVDQTPVESTPVIKERVALTEDTKMLSKHWTELLQELKSANHSLSAFLRVGHPITVSSDIVTLGFEYDFHAERVREAKNRRAAELALSKILGRTVRLEAVVDGNYQGNHQNFYGAGDQEVEDALDVLGGELV